jgi:hypothetical protein
MFFIFFFQPLVLFEKIVHEKSKQNPTSKTKSKENKENSLHDLRRKEEEGEKKR